MNHESYGNFIFLSDEMKERVSNMSDTELDFFSGFLAHTIIETQLKIMDKMNKENECPTE